MDGAGLGTTPEAGPPPATHRQLAATFLRISLTGFGGPNAHLALMLDEVVERRRWITREHFLQLVGITNLLPGPNSSETAIHIGYTQRGWSGALTTGLSFLGPTFLLVLLFSWLYFRFGTLPQADPLFWALKPVIVAIILWAGWRLGRPLVTKPILFVLALAGGLVTFFAGRWTVLAMILGGGITWWAHRARGREDGGPGGGEARPPEGSVEPPSGRPAHETRGGHVARPGREHRDPERPGPERPGPGGGASTRRGPERRGVAMALPVLAAGGVGLGSVAQVFLLHLWIGCVLFGGGYVLVALLEPYAVDAYRWLTPGEFLDGVALTQAVPGPISTLAAFVGYAAAGLPGAVAGTAGVYLPAFAVVLFVAPHLDRLRRLDAVQATLEGVSAVVAGTILGVGLSLMPPALPDVWAGLLFAAALVAFVRYRVASHWMVLLALGIGLARFLVL